MISPSLSGSERRCLVGATETDPSSSSLQEEPMTAPAARFTDKVVFVTGAGTGIGRATSIAFAAEAPGSSPPACPQPMWPRPHV
jgi:hypothetical protein